MVRRLEVRLYLDEDLLTAVKSCADKWHIDVNSTIRVILSMYFNGELIPIPKTPPSKKQIELSKQAALIREWEPSKEGVR